MKPNNWFPKYLLNLYVWSPCQLALLEQFDAEILCINTYLANSNLSTNNRQSYSSPMTLLSNRFSILKHIRLNYPLAFAEGISPLLVHLHGQAACTSNRLSPLAFNFSKGQMIYIYDREIFIVSSLRPMCFRNGIAWQKLMKPAKYTRRVRLGWEHSQIRQQNQ